MPPLLLIAILLGGVLVAVGSVAFFFGKILVVIAVGGIVYAMATGNLKVESATPILAVALLAPILFNVFGLSAITPQLQALEPSSADPDYPAVQGEVQVDKPQGQMLATSLSPGTYRPVSIKLKNEDDLPLRLDGTVIYAFAGDCEKKNIAEKAAKFLSSEVNPCKIKQGETMEIKSGSFRGLIDFGKKASETNNFGVTAEVPAQSEEESAGKDILDQYAQDWKSRTAIEYIDMKGPNGDEKILLWSQAKCEKFALDNVDCSKAQKQVTIKDEIFVWADRKVETPATKTLSVVFLTPTEDDIESKAQNTLGYGLGCAAGAGAAFVAGPVGAGVGCAAGALTSLTVDGLSPLEEHDYRVTAVMKKQVRFMTPTIKWSLAFGGIGLLGILGVYYRERLPLPV